MGNEDSSPVPCKLEMGLPSTDSRRIRNDENGLEWVLTGNTTNCADYHLRSSVSPLVWLIKLTCRNDVESELSWKFISESNLIFG